MALKLKITKEQFEKLPNDIKTEYKPDGDIYVLDVSDLEDTGALKRAKDREAELRREAEKKAKELQTKLDELDTNDARKSGDLERLTKSYEAKLVARETELTEKITKLQEASKKSLLDATATSLASKLFVPDKLRWGKRDILDRLTVDFDGDEPSVKVLDASGKLSALTLADLEKEIVDNKENAGILIGSKASGGGAPGGGQKQRLFGSAGSSDDKPMNLATADPRIIAQAIKERKAAEGQG